MQLSSQSLGATRIVTVDAARIDAAVAIQFKDLMRSEVPTDISRAILNLEQVEFVDSSGLGAIVAAMKALSDGPRLDLAGLQPAVQKVFHLTRMDSIFLIFDSVEEALEHAAA